MSDTSANNHASPHKGHHRIYEPDHINALDGLRALAIIMVMARHSLKFFREDYNAPFIPVGPFDFGHLIMNAWCGVDLFFVLSGFLIARQLLIAFETSQDMAPPHHASHRAFALFKAPVKNAVLYFWKKRFFRIAPAYYLVLVLACTGLFPPFPYYKGPDLWKSFLEHLIYMQDYTGSDIVIVFWSLALEAKFYLIAPLLIWILAKRRHLFTTPILLGLMLLASIALKLYTALYLMPPQPTYSGYSHDMRYVFHLTLDGFIVGTLAAFLWHSRIFRPFILNRITANVLFFGGLALCVGLTGFHNLLDQHVSMFDMVLLTPLLAIAFGGMLLGLLGDCKARKFFSAIFLRYIAKISYSLYLVHLLFIVPAWNLTNASIPATDPIIIRWLFFLLPYTAMSIFTAVPLYYFVEQPFIKWAKKRKPFAAKSSE